MSLDMIKEVKELIPSRIASSPLGKLVSGKIFPETSVMYDKPLGLLCENKNFLPIEGNNGHWDGERGDSKWTPDQNYVPQKCNPEGKTWSEILRKYGIDNIKYKDGEPDFSEISKGTVKIEQFSENRAKNFQKADEKLAKPRGCSPQEVKEWRAQNGYTWHECKDMKTMQKVPSEVHSNMPHNGGIAMKKVGGDL